MMVRHFWKSALSLCILQAVSLLFISQPVIAREANCVISQDETVVRSAPAIFANEDRKLDKGDRISASKQAMGASITWLLITYDDWEEGWVDSESVDGCNWTALPKVPPPGQQSTLTGQIPPVDQRGVETVGIFVPPSIKAGFDELLIFDERLDITFDLSIRAFERNTQVRSVEFFVRDENGPIYHRVDNKAPYCLFGAGTNQCNTVWRFAQTNYFWPIDERVPLRPSNRKINPNAVHTIGIEVKYSDEDSDNWQWNFRVIPWHIPAHDLYIVPYSDSRSGSFSLDAAEVRIQSDTLASDLPEFRNKMVFSLGLFPDMFPHDQKIGTVQFRILDGQSNQAVYQHTESFAPYCVFGNTDAALYCDTIWRFSDTDYLWRDSDSNTGVIPDQKIQYGHPYRTIITMTDGNGNFGGEWQFDFEIVEGDAYNEIMPTSTPAGSVSTETPLESPVSFQSASACYNAVETYPVVAKEQGSRFCIAYDVGYYDGSTLLNLNDLNEFELYIKVGYTVRLDDHSNDGEASISGPQSPIMLKNVIGPLKYIYIISQN
jgi:hypothetical protein